MSVAKSTAICPFCKEPINAGAVKCKHCQSDLSGIRKTRTNYFARYNTFRYGFLAGILFTVAVALLGYFQFFRD
ncbi:MAG: hypothetical protein AB1644_13110 [Candidatus Zixiibacteriota bacterium]